MESLVQSLQSFHSEEKSKTETRVRNEIFQRLPYPKVWSVTDQVERLVRDRVLYGVAVLVSDHLKATMRPIEPGQANSSYLPPRKQSSG